MEFKLGQLRNNAVIELLEQHHQEMLRYSPPESVHALDISALEAPEISFWSIWLNGQLAGCGALKQLSADHGEIKSMRTASQFLRRGIARQMLEHIIAQAKQRGYQRLSLETGTAEAFLPAQSLYQSFGFSTCPPFGGYQEDPYSTFFTKILMDER